MRDVLFPLSRPTLPRGPAWPSPEWVEGLRGLDAAWRSGAGLARALDGMERSLEAGRAAREAALASRARRRLAGAALAVAWWMGGIGGSVSLAITGHDAIGIAMACCLPLPTLALLAADLVAGRA